MATQDLEATVRQMYEAWNAKDFDRCASFAHPDCRVTMIPFGTKLAFREYEEGWGRAFPDAKLEVTNVVVQGDRVVAEFTGRGTHTGTMKTPTGDLAPTGKRLELACVESLRFRDGKVAECRSYFDAFSMFTQLGIGAPPQGRSAAAETQPRH